VDLQSITPVTQSFADRNSSSKLQSDAEHKAAELKEAFTDFVGQTLFGSMLASMRKTVGKPAYMHGGRTEEVFQQQLDQKIVEELTDASASEISDPMFELFKMGRTP
jgi:flagellar protein FlgJ